MKEMPFLLTSGRNGHEAPLRKARAVLPFGSAAPMRGAFSRKGEILAHSWCKW